LALFLDLTAELDRYAEIADDPSATTAAEVVS